MEFNGSEARRRREAAGLSRHEIVAAFIRAGDSITEQTVLRWESGQSVPGGNRVALLATALGCGLEDLYSEKVGAA